MGIREASRFWIVLPLFAIGACDPSAELDGVHRVTLWTPSIPETWFSVVAKSGVTTRWEVWQQVLDPGGQHPAIWDECRSGENCPEGVRSFFRLTSYPPVSDSGEGVALTTRFCAGGCSQESSTDVISSLEPGACLLAGEGSSTVGGALEVATTPLDTTTCDTSLEAASDHSYVATLSGAERPGWREWVFFSNLPSAVTPDTFSETNCSTAVDAQIHARADLAASTPTSPLDLARRCLTVRIDPAIREARQVGQLGITTNAEVHVVPPSWWQAESPYFEGRWRVELYRINPGATELDPRCQVGEAGDVTLGVEEGGADGLHVGLTEVLDHTSWQWQLALVGVDTSQAGVVSCVPLSLDLDGDGLTGSGGDCQDNNALVGPGLAEVCNGEDDNCDGEVDEGVSGEYLTDADGDGFGAEPSGVSCVPGQIPPVGLAGRGGDCDDNLPVVHPGAAEVCNFKSSTGLPVDDNCDGVLSPALDQLTDLDGDGRGEALWVRPSQSTLKTIQSALDMIPHTPAAQGLTTCRAIAVDPGAYTENVYVDNLDVSIESLGGAGRTWLDGGGDTCTSSRCTTLTVRGGSRVNLVGFTLRNGRGQTAETFTTHPSLRSMELRQWANKSLRGVVPGIHELMAAEGDVAQRFGGLVVVERAQLTLEGVILSGGKADMASALLAWDQSFVTLNDVQVTQNETLLPTPTGSGVPSHIVMGGAVVADSSRLDVFDSDVTVNQVDPANIETVVAGTGITSAFSDLTLFNSKISTNVGHLGGGVTWIEGQDSGSTWMGNNELSWNIMDLGAGGLLWIDLIPEEGSPASEVVGTIIGGNTVLAGWAGGAHVWGSSPHFRSDLFSGNLSMIPGGGLRVDAVGEVEISHSLFDRNYVNVDDVYGRGRSELEVVPLDVDSAAGPLNLTVHSTIFTTRQPNAIDCEDGSFAWNGLFGPAPFGSGCILPGATDYPLTAAPFVNWINTNSWFQQDYHLVSGSPLVNGGDPAVAESDEDGTVGDVGAYGGPDGKRGLGTFTSSCLTGGGHFAGYWLDGSGQVSASLTSRDIPEAAGVFRDVYLVWLHRGETFSVQVSSTSFVPRLRLVGASQLRYTWPTTTTTGGCASTDVLTSTWGPSGVAALTNFVPPADGYYALLVSGDTSGSRRTGPYTLSSL